MRLRLRERMEYRAAFLLGVIAQGIGYAAEVAVIWLTLNRFDVIAGWNWSEMALLYSLSVITYALGAAFTYSPMTELEQMVQKGTLESVLIKPTNPFLTLVGQRFNIGYVSHLLLAGSIFIWATTTASIDWSLVNVLLLASAV